jgi:adenylate cyclase
LIEKTRKMESSISIGIGIETGEVLVGNFGGEKYLSYTCIGDRVNTAARIKNCAEADQILVGPGTFKSVSNQELFVSMGDQALKGKDEPLELFRYDSTHG